MTHGSWLVVYHISSLVPRPLPDRFYLAAVEKNREKAWDQNYVTDQKWWTRLVQTESTLLRGAWEGPGNKATTFPQSDAAATTFFTVCFSAATNQGWLLFEGRIYFIGKPADSNDG